MARRFDYDGFAMNQHEKGFDFDYDGVVDDGDGEDDGANGD